MITLVDCEARLKAMVLFISFCTFSGINGLTILLKHKYLLDLMDGGYVLPSIL